MKNVQTEVKGATLIITVDCSKSFGPSKTGKSQIIASTEGNQSLTVNGKAVCIGLNVYSKLS